MWWKRKQQDFNAEIEAHLQLEADELISEGVNRSDAQSAARRTFGNRMLTEERFYEFTHWMFLDRLIQDLRFASRVLAKDARFTVLATVGLAFGIGVSTAMFTLINAMVQTETAQDKDAASNVGLNLSVKGVSTGDIELSYPDYCYYRDRASSFRAMKVESGRAALVLGPSPNGKAIDEALDVQGRFESANFLSAEGLQPDLGRSFSPQEERVGGPAVVLLNSGFWKRRFAADRTILGKTLVLNAHRLTVIGIADARYGVGDRTDVYLPLTLEPVLLPQGDWLHDPEERWLMVEAWLRPGITARKAQAEADVLASALRGNKPLDLRDEGVFISPGGVNPRKTRES